MKKTAVVLLAVLFLSAPLLAAPRAGGVARPIGKLEGRAIPPVVHVGDEVRLVIQAQFPKGYSIEPISAKTQFLPFELVKIDKPLSVRRGDRILETIIIRLTIFELGDFKVPSIRVAVWNVAGQRAEARTPPMPVRVISIGKARDDQPDIRPIKGPASVPLFFLYETAASVLAFLLSILLIILILKRKKKVSDPESLLPPHERLARELGRLRESGWLGAGRAKEYYTELSDILRRYLERRFGFEIMEHTSAEIESLLKEKQFDGVLIAEVREVLEKADLVKFARFVPERSLAGELEKRLFFIAEATRPAAEPAGERPKGKRK